MDGASIRFPNLGIEIENLGKSVSVFGFEIAYYGIIIGIGMILGILLACHVAKKHGFNPDACFDYAIYGIIFGIVGARLYYVIFSWDYYKKDLMQIFNLRAGGLAIYGGVIGAVVTMIVYSKIKKISFWQLADCGVTGLILGQIIGRWGNFMNREAFGGYADGLFAMQIRVDEAAYSTPELLEKMVTIGGVDYIQVQPTFLYESLWNVCVLILMLIYFKHKKFNGEIFMIYLGGYGLGRLWIEGLRTDQLLLPVVGIPVSQLLAGILFVGAVVVILVGHIRKNKKAAAAETILDEGGTSEEENVEQISE